MLIDKTSPDIGWLNEGLTRRTFRRRRFVASHASNVVPAPEHRTWTSEVKLSSALCTRTVLAGKRGQFFGLAM
jgi:hypothetical protein